MPVEAIPSLDDPRVADYRVVSEPELARRRGLFVAEGRLVLQRLIAERRYVLRSVLVNDAARRDLESNLDALPSSVPVFVCDGADFAALTGYHLQRGCVALVERPPRRSLADVLSATDRLVVLEGVANADNVGGVFRNAAAFGVGAVVLDPTSCDPLYRKAIRTSMAATLAIPFVMLDDWPGPLDAVRDAGFTTVALTPRAPSETIDAFLSRPRARRIALVIGAEGAGVSPAVERMADHRVRIETTAAVDSLNLAVATGIALHRLHGGS
jgi:tRNA G18 (ribose-2'-O)-methylase SpoU